MSSDSSPLSQQCMRHSNFEVGFTVSPKDHNFKEQLHQDIENKLKACCNPSYECSIPRIDGYDYCARHILLDPRGNYRQCTFSYTNGRKCPNAVLRHDVKKDPSLTTLCFEHNRQEQLQKTHATVGKLRRLDTNEALLHSITHHVNVEEVQPEKQDEEIDVVSPHVAPFVSHEQVNDIKTVNSSILKRRRVLDYASDSSGGEDPSTLANTSRGYEFHDSDDNSIDSEEEDLLKHAGIYTREEAIRISEAKLAKLQGLYLDQINQLHHVLKDRRRRYLYAIRKERERNCSIHDQLKETPHERLLYEQFKALNSYHRRHGTDAVLHKKMKEKRTRAVESCSQRVPSVTKCTFTEGGVKCSERSLPCCKFCRKHILEDKKQILFRACEVEKSGVVCQEPVPCIFDDAEACILHLPIPPRREYFHKKCESETEEEQIVLMKTENTEDKILLKKEKINADNEESSNMVPAEETSPGINITIAHDQKDASIDARDTYSN